MSVSIDGAGSLIGVDQGLNIVGLTTLTGGIILDDSISHIGDTDTKIRFPAADTFTVETAGSERLRIKSDGNVGIGTENPDTQLQLFGSSTTGNLKIGGGNGAGNHRVFISCTETNSYIDSYGNNAYGKLRINAAPLLLNDSGGGSVGIGTTNPSETLTLNHANGASIGLEYAGSEHGTLSVNSAAMYARAGSGKHLILGGNATESLRLKSDGKSYFTGNLGLGGQTSPGADIHINNFGNSGYELKLTGNTLQFNRTSNSYIDQLNDTGSILFRMTSSNTEAMRITSAGRIGINETSPTARLDIDHPNTEQGLVVRSRYGNINTAMVKFDGDPDSNGGDGNVLHIHGGSSRTDSEILHVNSTGEGTCFQIRGDGRTRVYKQLQLEHSSNTAKIIFNEYGANDIKAQIEMDQVSGSAGQLIFRTQDSGTLSERLRITSAGRVIAGKNMSQAISSIDYCDVDFHCTGPLSVGSNSNTNQAEMQKVGRRVINLYNTTYSGSGGNYLHLETSLWGGGSPHGNSEFIMGGFHIHGYRYNTSGICEEIIYFHQWNGGLANYSRYQYGNWNASSSCYVGSNGNVYIRLPNASYYGFAIDFIQHPWYSVRDCTILNATFSNSSSL